MTENDNTARDSQHESIEEAADQGPLPGIENIDQAEEEGREDSSVPVSGDPATDGSDTGGSDTGGSDTGDDAEDIAVGGTILGAVHGR